MTNNTIFNTTKTLEEYSEKKLFGVGEMPLLNTIHKNYPELWKTYKDMKALDWDENEFNYSKDFSNATNKVGYDEGAKISLLFNNMEGDMFRLLKCAATGKSSSFFDNVREAYLNNGFPCGWDGFYPNGKLVVYSNE